MPAKFLTKLSWRQATHWSSVLLGLSSLVFLAGLVQVVSQDWGGSSSANGDGVLEKTSITERDLAIAEAIRLGQKEYSFTTNFIPGMGRISDTGRYQEEWQKNAEKQNQTPKP